MRRINITNNEIMTVPQFMARYERLAEKIIRMEKKFDKQFDKIFEILDKLTKQKVIYRIGFKR